MKSSFSSNGANCLEVSSLGNDSDLLEIEETSRRFSDDTYFSGSQSLVTDKESFAAFIKGVKAGEFDHFVGE